MAKRKKKPEEQAESVGRPDAIINWKQLDSLLQAGCSGAQIAGLMGIHPETLYDNVVRHKGVAHFSDYSQQMRARGDDLIRAKQFELAMKGNGTMLVWLGKNRLQQTDKVAHMGKDGKELPAPVFNILPPSSK